MLENTLVIGKRPRDGMDSIGAKRSLGFKKGAPPAGG